MSADIIDQRRRGLVGAAFSGLALLGRPGLVFGWALAAIPIFLLFIVSIRLATGYRFAPAIILAPLFGIALRASQSVLSSAAYRARLRPEMGGPAYLRLGHAEWRVFAMGLGRNPGGIPLHVFIGLGALLIVMILAIFLASSLLGPAAAYFGIPMAFLIWVSAIMVANARAGLAGVAAFSGRGDPQTAGWELGSGHGLALIGAGLAISLMALTAAGLLIGGWWVVSSSLAVPSALWAPDLPTDEARWLRLALEIGSLSVVLGLLQALMTAFGATAHAEMWSRLGGDREAALRRSLFDA